jgi:predicted integral membrane protein DUF2269
VSTYEWLLFLHVLSAFALVGATVVFLILLVATQRAAAASDALAALRLTPLARRLWDIGGGGTLFLGIALAIDVDGYEVWDGWILAAIVLWAIAAGAGIRVGMGYTEARDAARAGGGGAVAREGRELALHGVMAVAIVALLVVMIYKPGA